MDYTSDSDLIERRHNAAFDKFCHWREDTDMRDILGSTKGRTASQRDYGRDAGDYVPLLERRPRQQYQTGILQRVERAGRYARGWDAERLADEQEARADQLRPFADLVSLAADRSRLAQGVK